MFLEGVGVNCPVRERERRGRQDREIKVSDIVIYAYAFKNEQLVNHEGACVGDKVVL